MISKILLLYCECVMWGSNKKMIEIKWRGWYCDGAEVIEKIWVNELQENCLRQEIVQFFPFKEQAGTLYIIEIMCLGQVRPKFQLCYFVLVS